MEKSSPKSVVKDSLTTPVCLNFRQTENSRPILLSLDLGTATGWALSNKHGRIMSGTAHFRHRRFEGGGMRYLRFERWLNEARDVSGGINTIYFEESPQISWCGRSACLWRFFGIADCMV